MQLDIELRQTGLILILLIFLTAFPIMDSIIEDNTETVDLTENSLMISNANIN